MAYKILVTDDNKDVVEILQKRLTQEGYVVVTAYDGEEALAKLKQDEPDVILLDLMMPKVDGFAVLEEIRKMREEFRDRWRPVIIISAKDELESKAKCYNLKAEHYLNKPCSIDDILKAIRKTVSTIPMRLK